jgi:hypothetical protein
VRHADAAQDRQRDAGDDLGLLGLRRDMQLPAAALDSAGLPLHEDAVARIAELGRAEAAVALKHARAAGRVAGGDRHDGKYGEESPA